MLIDAAQAASRRNAELVECYRNEFVKPLRRAMCTLGLIHSGAKVDLLISGLQEGKALAAGASTLKAA